MNHAFFVVRTSEVPPADYRRFLRSPGDIEVHDDLLQYFGDTLAWIPAHNPARDEACMGLCMYGPTVLHADGARVAAAVFSTWARLFALGPPQLDLTGAYGWVEGESSPGEYQRLRLDRDVVCSLLNHLAQRAEQVASGQGQFYLLHLGI